MKKVLSYILILLIISVNLFAPFSVLFEGKNIVKIQKNEVVAADNCKIISADWSEKGGETVPRPDSLILNIKTSDCTNRTLTVILNEENRPIQSASVLGLKIVKDDISINYTPGEELCRSTYCKIKYSIFLRVPTETFGEVSLIQEDDLKYQCTAKDSCNETIKWATKLEDGSQMKGDYDFTITPTVGTTDKTAEIKISVKNNIKSIDASGLGVLASAKLYIQVDLKDKDRKPLNPPRTLEKEMAKDGGVQDFTFDGLTSGTTYIVSVSIIEKSTITTGTSVQNITRPITTIPEKIILTRPKGETTLLDQGNMGEAKMEATPLSTMPACIFGSPLSGTISGCIAQAMYYMLYVPTSYLFALAGLFFDSTFAYSVNDTSYRSSFVVQGWGLVRDFCNMFFIFIMLYIAIGTILSLHSMKTKETIINVVIIGLFINFSLFASQVIIDASNITARVFYNSNAIKITQGGVDGASTAFTDVQDGGVIPLSSAIVNKVNPQNIILNAGKINQGSGQISSTDKAKLSTKDASEQKGLANQDPNWDSGAAGFTAGTFILIVLMTTAVNVVGFIVFLSVGLIFISRVIGLWLAMILSPVAFFTYILPEMAGTKMIGWKNWWPETLKLAFLAPVFMFFLYIILKFLETGLISGTSNKEGLSFFIATLIPFAFVMILMWKAKNIASDMSGEFGKQVTGAVSAGGAMLLGGAALGGALLGRKVIGAGLASASRSDSSMHLATQKFEHNKKLEEWESNNKKGIPNKDPKPVFKAPVNGEELKDANGNVRKDAKGNPLTYKEGIRTRIGAALNEKQMKIGSVDLARSQIDEIKKAAGLEGVDDTNLSGLNEKKMVDKYNTTKRAETEAAVRKGVGADGKEIFLNDESGKPTIKGEEAYKVANRKRISDEVKNDPEALKNGDTTKSGALSATGQKKIDDKLKVELNNAVKVSADAKLSETFNKILKDSRQKVGGVERAFSQTNTGTWDARNLSSIKSDKREGFFTKMPVALTAAIAMGMRTGIKSSGLSGGSIKVEGNFMKDLSNTISDSLKSAKVNVDLSHVGETKSSANAHGGDAGAHH